MFMCIYKCINICKQYLISPHMCLLLKSQLMWFSSITMKNAN